MIRLRLLSFGVFGYIFYVAVKILEISLRLAYSLISIANLRIALVQNPPSIPTLPVVWVSRGLLSHSQEIYMPTQLI